MNAQELEELCSPQKARYFKAPPYWTSELYGFGKYLREYGYYPSFLPLCVYSDHGVSYYLDPTPHELNNDSPTQLYHSPETARRYRFISAKPCYVMYSPFVFFRQTRKVTQSPKAKGTLAFPAHSTPAIHNKGNFEEYIQQLKKLPQEYQPVSICLHMHDINQGLHHVFLKHDFPVFTAGNTSDYGFTERFYKILSQFKYTTSNFVGSYAFYAVEMGIPFFIYGSREKYINISDHDVPKDEHGIYDPYQLFPRYKQFYELFNTGPIRMNTAKQIEVVITTLGLKEGLSRSELSRVLYISLVKFVFSKAIFRWIIGIIKFILTNRTIIKTL